MYIVGVSQFVCLTFLISLFTDGDWNFYWYVCCSASFPACQPSTARYFVAYRFVLQVMRRGKQGGERVGEEQEENEKIVHRNNARCINAVVVIAIKLC